MAGARRPAIVLASVYVLDPTARLTAGRGHVLLLDVRVEGIEKHADVGVVHLARQRHRIRRGIQEVRFKPVQRFDGQADVVGDERRTERLKSLDRPFPFVRGAPPARKVADRRVQRTGQQPRPHAGRRLDTFLQVRSRRPADRGVVAQHAEPWQENG